MFICQQGNKKIFLQITADQHRKKTKMQKSGNAGQQSSLLAVIPWKSNIRLALAKRVEK